MRNKSFFTCILCVILCSLTLLLVFLREPEPLGKNGKSGQSVYERVLTAKRIRAAYTVYPPSAIKDPNTGQLSGIFVEALEAVGRKLDLKIEWTEEVGFGNAIEGLQTDRYDILGSGLWRNSTRGRAAYFSDPLYFNAVRVWTRADETRFHNLSDLNQSNVRIAVQDGAMEDVIARTDFPNAKRVSIPQLTQWSDVLVNLTSDKADVTFAELGVITPFLKSNPGTLKELNIGRPIRVFSASFALKLGQNEFKSMVDSAIEEIINDGTMESILKKYETSPGDQLRRAVPYQPPGN